MSRNKIFEEIVNSPLTSRKGYTIFENLKQVSLTEIDDPEYGYILVDFDNKGRPFYNGKEISITKAETVTIATGDYRTACSYTSVPNVRDIILEEYNINMPFSYFAVALTPKELMQLDHRRLFPIIKERNSFNIAKVRLIRDVVLCYGSRYTYPYAGRIVVASGFILEEVYSPEKSRKMILDDLDKTTKKSRFFDSLYNMIYWNETAFYEKYISKVNCKSVLCRIKNSVAFSKKDNFENQRKQTYRQHMASETGNMNWYGSVQEVDPMEVSRYLSQDISKYTIEEINNMVCKRLRYLTEDECVQVAARIADNPSTLNGTISYAIHDILAKSKNKDVIDFLLSASAKYIRDLYKKTNFNKDYTEGETEYMIGNLYSLSVCNRLRYITYVLNMELDDFIHNVPDEIAYAFISKANRRHALFTLFNTLIPQITSHTLHYIIDRVRYLAYKLGGADVRDEVMKDVICELSRNVSLLSKDIIFEWARYIDFGAVLSNGPHPDIIDHEDWMTINIPGFGKIPLNENIFCNFEVNKCCSDMIRVVNSRTLMEQCGLKYLIIKRVLELGHHVYGSDLPFIKSQRSVNHDCFYQGNGFTPAMLNIITRAFPSIDIFKDEIINNYIEAGCFTLDMFKIEYNMKAKLSMSNVLAHLRVNAITGGRPLDRGAYPFNFFTGKYESKNIKKKELEFFANKYGMPMIDTIVMAPLDRDAMSYINSTTHNLIFTEGDLYNNYNLEDLEYIAKTYKDNIKSISPNFYSSLPSNLQKLLKDCVVE